MAVWTNERDDGRCTNDRSAATQRRTVTMVRSQGSLTYRVCQRMAVSPRGGAHHSRFVPTTRYEFSPSISASKSHVDPSSATAVQVYV